MLVSPAHVNDPPARWWTVAVIAAITPLLVLLVWTLWRSPYPINEAVALFEDIVRNSPRRFLLADTPYYRPLYHLSLMAIWTHAGSLAARLAWIKVLHVAPMVILPLLLVWHLRPQDRRAALAAIVAAAVLVGSPGYRDNLEVPLAYTAVGMLLAFIVWMLLEAPRAAWRTALVVLLTMMAIGFKEQGLVIVPLILSAWWMRAPGASRGLAIGVLVIMAAYLAYRLQWRGQWGVFQQSMGLGFSIIEPNEAVARFGAFPYGMYAYNSVSTMLNVLFAEPTSGLYFITRNVRFGGLQAWEIINLGSSALLTAGIAWWSWRVLARGRRDGWSIETRACAAMLVALLASGVLSFDYSRDRLGGMAVPFYALAAFFAFQHAGTWARNHRQAARAAVMTALVCITAGWTVRAYGTVEWVRRTSEMNHDGWLVQLGPRRQEFKDRPVYLAIMQSMAPQGLALSPPRPTKRPWWLASVFLPQAPGSEIDTFTYSPAEAIAHGDVDATYDFIRKGWNPDQLTAASDPNVTGGRTVLVSPLVWAAAQRRRDIVSELLTFGAHVDAADNRAAPCVADAVGAADVAKMLRDYDGALAPGECPAWTRHAPFEWPQ